MAALCTVMSFFFFYLIDRKHQILRAHNAARPRVDCKFLLVVFCGCIDLKSVCIAFLLSLSLSLALSIPLASVWALYGCIALRLCTTPITLLADDLTASIWFTGSLRNVREIDWSILFLLYPRGCWCVTTAKSHWNSFYCYRTADLFVTQMATREHRNDADGTQNIVYCKSPSVHVKFIFMAFLSEALCQGSLCRCAATITTEHSSGLESTSNFIPESRKQWSCCKSSRCPLACLESLKAPCCDWLWVTALSSA